MNWAALAADIERATLDAVPPSEREEHGGWLLGLDAGTVWRAKSAAPLTHGTDLLASVDTVVARYRSAGLKPCFRMPDVPELGPVQDRLNAQGLTPGESTHVQWIEAHHLDTALAKTRGIATPCDAPSSGATEVQVVFQNQPDETWCAVFLGEGFDPVDGASRTQILKRAVHAHYASVQVQGVTVAVGMGSYSQGWASIHGMRTLPAWRGRGYALAIMSRLLAEGQRRQLDRVFLQVEGSNAHARAIYRRLGFQDLWTYRYWQSGAPA